MKNKIFTILLLWTVFLFSACNKHGSGEGELSFSKASLVDASVEGVAFSTSSGGSGYTDSNGSLSYSSADSSISFSIGGVDLGDFNLLAINSDKQILITDLVGVDRDDSTNPQVVKILQFLQSLDDDNNSSNGIVITAAISKELEEFSLDFTDINLDIEDINKALIALDKRLVTSDEAIAHFEITLNRDFGYNLNSIAPIFYSQNEVTINENSRFVLNLDIFDTSEIRVTLSGADAEAFHISDGSLYFNCAPDFENKASYKVNLVATDLGKNSTTQNITIDIKDVGGVDDDGDFIPNDIEYILGMDATNSDENENGVLDGLESNATFGDQFFDKQWHIRSLGTFTNDSNLSTIAGNDLDVLDIYHTYMGYNKAENIIIQVVDSGVDADHEDLVDNMDLSRSYNGEVVGDPSGSHWHGTAVAGIMAARAFNTIGVRGIIPFAKIAGSNWLDTQTPEEIEKAWLSGDGANEIAVANNSWGDYINTETLYEEIMAIGTSTLRDGKGRLYVFAAGNERDMGGNANLVYLNNNHYAISVAALKNDNTYAMYSNPGSNILVSGYSGEFYTNSPTISTTTIEGNSSNEGNLSTKTTWSEDSKENYTFTMNGTSAASPTVAASIALVLEACPDLTWRDIKYLVATTAKKVDINNSTWIENSAGHIHSIDYGYGLINPRAMISECLSSSYEHLSVEQNQSVSQTFNTAIPDNNSTTISFELELTQEPISVEWVEVTIDNNGTYASDYEISLISPALTQTLLMQGNNFASDPEYGSHGPAWMNGGFRFSSAAFLDESSQGVWCVNIKDINLGDSGTVKNIKLQIYGH